LKLDSIYVKLQQSSSSSQISDNGQYSAENHARQLLLQLFNSITSPTTATSLQKTLINRLLLTTAAKHNCKTLMTASNATTLASVIVYQLALGGGYTLPLDISYDTVFSVKSNFRHDKELQSRENTDQSNVVDIVLFRPFRDILETELEQYRDFEVERPIQLVPEVVPFWERKKGRVPETPLKVDTIHSLARSNILCLFSKKRNSHCFFFLNFNLRFCNWSSKGFSSNGQYGNTDRL
jgi:hypothetical protein